MGEEFTGAIVFLMVETMRAVINGEVTYR